MKIQKKYDFIIMLEYLLLFAICGFMIIYPLVTMNKEKMRVMDIIFSTVAIIILVYFLVNLLTIKYVIDDKHLYINRSMNRATLELKKIVEIKHKKRLLCGSITARKCLEIVYSPYGSSADLRYFYVSVKNEQELIEKIQEKSKKLKIS